MAKGGKAAETVLAAREEARPLLTLVNKAIVSRMTAGRHVFAEHPAGSLSWDQEEMSGVKDLLEKGKLRFVRADGCALGYRDRESGLPHYKPMGIITSMDAVAECLCRYRCTRDHVHQPLEGSNC